MIARKIKSIAPNTTTSDGKNMSNLLIMRLKSLRKLSSIFMGSIVD